MPTIILLFAALGLAGAAYLLWRRSLAHASEATRLGEDMRAADAFAEPRDAPDTDDDTLLLTDVLSEPAPQNDLRYVGAIGALLAPGAVFLLQGPTASALMWLATFAALGGLFVAERFAWRPASWFAALGATAWAFAALFFMQPVPSAIWPPLFFALLALAGLVHMRRNLWAGFALMTGMAAAAATGAIIFGAATPYGAALTGIIIAAAIAGATWRTHEPALAAAWFIACGALFVLSGQDSADAWLTPACVMCAALFLGVESVTLPEHGRDAMLHAATGAIAAPFAIGVLYGGGFGPGLPLSEPGSPASAALMQGLMFFVIASVQGFIIRTAAHRQGGLRELGFALAPPALAIGVCLIAAPIVALGPLWSAAPLAAFAVGAAYVERRASNPMWNVLALGFTLAAMVQVARAGFLLLVGLGGEEALTVIFAGIAAPALLVAIAARVKGSTSSWTSAALEAAAIVLAFAAILAFVRWIASGGLPGQLFITFVEAGVLATIWLVLSIPLLLREARGAFFVRRGTAIVLVTLACAALTLGPLAMFNPWWGSRPTPALGLPILNLLAIGYGAPLAAFAGLAWIAHRRVWRRTRVFATLAASIMGAAWIALEIRRAFHGADLHASSGEVSGAEAFAFSLAALTGAIALYFYRVRRDPIEPALAFLLAGALLVKIGFIDLHIAADAWRAASFATMAFAFAALAAPRED
ncbi:MAG: DUF2339 domain-containing protein [Hyphomonadaceae bacterium]